MTSIEPRGVAEVEAMDAVFSALAHRSRRTILTVLLARRGEMTSKAIAQRFRCSWATTSRHLAVLEKAGLVDVVTRGRERLYQLQNDRLGDVAGSWLDRFRESAPEAASAESSAESVGVVVADTGCLLAQPDERHSEVYS